MASSSDNISEIVKGEIAARDADISSINHKARHSEDRELAYEEHAAHDNFVAALKKLGLEVTPHAYGVDTSFSCDFGQGGRLIVFNAEYDALPGIGHACGHNLIASASFAAFLGVCAALKKTGIPGRVRLLGTPAEEGGGGKLKLIAGGAFKNVSACLMVHPGPQYLLKDPVREVAYVRMLANVKYKVHFTGRASHAAMLPWNGVNALDAVCLSYNAISMLRQQIKPYERIHGVFREAGDRPNIIPSRTTVEYYVRSDTRAAAEALWQRVKKCFEGASVATGCGIEFEHLNSYADVRPSKVICEEYVKVMPEGTVSYADPPDILAGSTDQGDVCYVCPSYHGAFGINTEVGQGNHTPGFTRASALQDSYQRALACGEGMALVGFKILSDDNFAERMKEDWEEDMKVATQT
ncbi:uncharacterized protein E0L32_008625 [Thyridium curvatum]|uniref:Peptidase M20 domain-containing protein 2 n=1 Tax=Thyridium curvatum TaxID=1093900 RepID=A0A507AUL9_9PEZI|nr:uncharacterized protein E0L32_008625 [Thyridium curvatum]TPX10406.1 hypothetical protein E0L32_008625 [Thyridium curvatum]